MIKAWKLSLAVCILRGNAFGKQVRVVIDSACLWKGYFHARQCVELTITPSLCFLVMQNCGNIGADLGMSTSHI